MPCGPIWRHTPQNSPFLWIWSTNKQHALLHTNLYWGSNGLYFRKTVSTELFPQQNSKSYTQTRNSVVCTVAQEIGQWLWQKQQSQCSGAGGSSRTGRSSGSGNSGRWLVVLVVVGVVTYTHTYEHMADTFSRYCLRGLIYTSINLQKHTNKIHYSHYGKRNGGSGIPSN